MTDPHGSQIQLLKLDDVIPGPADERRDSIVEEELTGLMHSIQRQGVLQPIIVTKVGDKYMTIAGRRRREACRRAGLKTIPAIVREADAQQQFEISTAENIFRSDLSPYEEAAACAAAIQSHGMDVDQVAAAMSRSRRWVEDRLEMLAWPEPLLKAVHERRLSIAAAGPLRTIRPEATLSALLEEAIRHGASARTTSAWAQAHHAAAHDGQPIDPSKMSEAPVPPPTIPHQNCWACACLGPVVSMSYLPTCSECYQSIPPAMQSANAHPPEPAPS